MTRFYSDARSNCRPIIATSIDGEQKRYPSIGCAADMLHLHRKTIQRALKQHVVVKNTWTFEYVSKELFMLQSEEEYVSALERIDEIFDAEPGTAEHEDLKRLVNAVEEYENKHHPIET